VTLLGVLNVYLAAGHAGAPVARLAMALGLGGVAAGAGWLSLLTRGERAAAVASIGTRLRRPVE